MPHLQEKRVAPRITAVVPVKARILAHAASALPSYRAALEKHGEFLAKTINVSRSGLLINSDADLVPGTRLALTLEAPDDGHTIRIEADVAWSRRNSINLFGRFAAGLRIRKIGESDRELLNAFFRGR
jgi:hypothetical protein